jgi:hypothetical protein
MSREILPVFSFNPVPAILAICLGFWAYILWGEHGLGWVWGGFALLVAHSTWQALKRGFQGVPVGPISESHTGDRELESVQQVHDGVNG